MFSFFPVKNYFGKCGAVTDDFNFILRLTKVGNILL
jgi:hypothetical protein